MKKVFPLLFAATIVSSPFAAYAQAEEVKQEVGADQTTDVNHQTEGGVAEETNQLEEVIELTLEDVIRRGTENSTNLTVLQLNLEITKNELLNSNYDKNKAARDIKKLEDRIEDLKDEREGLEGEARTDNFEDRAEYRELIEALEEQIESLEISVQKIEAGQLQLQLQEEEAKEGVRLMLTSSYTNLLLLQEQIEFTKKSLQSVINNVNKHQLLYKLGRVSQETLRQVQIAQENVERQLEDQEKSYRYKLADFSFDIGVAYHPDMVVKPVGFEPVDYVAPEDYSSLIEDSFKMKRAQKDLESAILDRDQVYKEYEDGDVSIYEKENQEYVLLIAEKMFASTKDDLNVAIEQLYRKGENSYSAYEEAVRQLEIKRKEIDVLQILYNLGRVSKYDYEQAQLGLASAELNVYQAKVQNYTIQQSIAALQKGYI